MGAWKMYNSYFDESIDVTLFLLWPHGWKTTMNGGYGCILNIRLVFPPETQVILDSSFGTAALT